MKIFLTAILLLCLPGLVLRAQDRNISGVIVDSLTRAPLNGATVVLNPGKRTTVSDENGQFKFGKANAAEKAIIISAVGYEKKQILLHNTHPGEVIELAVHETLLSDVVVYANSGNPYKTISEADIKMRGVSNSQEVLRIVPGLFIGQHQGGGKAEQIFLRGFDADHGTDISLNVDGMPINMVSHAHGQGYADSHFIIPETIERTDYKKGTYDAEKGNLVTSGFVDFHTADAISGNLIRVEGGQFDTYRALAMFDLLGDRYKAKGQSWYVASEYRFSNSYFDNPQHFNRLNIFSKFSTRLSGNTRLLLSASVFHSSWFASGQIPDQAIDQGIVGFYGALDPNEGGVTSRNNINAQFITSFKNNGILKNQFYYSRYKFDLHTDFTFFLEDPVNGDEIRQKEKRNLYGYHGSYLYEHYLGNIKLTSKIGLDARLDVTDSSELSHTKNRYTLLNRIKLGNINELNTGAYVSETFQFNEKFSINAGLRFDEFAYHYQNLFAGDTTFNGTGKYRASNHSLSPKLNFYEQLSSKTELYLSLGKGFHSNDARVVVAEKGTGTLPSAYTGDFGVVYKPFDNLLFNASLWYIYLQKEFVYGGDGGTVDFSGRTRRVGADLSARYQPVKSILFDLDLNYAHGRAIDEPDGQNYIPLAPVLSSTAGITYSGKSGINASFRYRYLSKRPANEDYSLTATGYFINDVVLNYTQRKYEIGLTINNIFNVKWKETQFDTVTRLKNEVTPVDGIAFTPGTKFAALAHISYFFR